MPEVFDRRRARGAADAEELVGELYQQIGQLKMEVDLLKKKSGFTSERNVDDDGGNSTQIPIRRQCALLGLHPRQRVLHAQHEDPSMSG